MFTFVADCVVAGWDEMICGSWKPKLVLAADVFLVSGLDLSTSDPSGETNGAVRAKETQFIFSYCLTHFNISKMQ